MRISNLRRLTAAALILTFILPQTAVAAAPEVETDESVYINLDYYGQPVDTRIVKGVSLNGHTEFTDYGNYTKVYNMSTYDEPTLSDGSVSWALTDGTQQRFYYECIPDENASPIVLPWNFDVSYKLNGVQVEAEDCAGASGTVEITVHAVPNDNASEYYKNNMMLVCGTGIDMSEALSIDAPGAQIQSLGTYKLVVFIGMPGEEETFTVRIGSDSFESMGMVLFMAPATLSSLDILADLKDIKDRIGDSGDDLYDGLSSMLDTMQSMQSGFDTMSSGISGINEVRKQLIAERGNLDPKTDAALDALQDLAGQSDSLIPELTSFKSTITALNTTMQSMLSTVEESGNDIEDYQELLKKMRQSLDNLEDMLNDLDEVTDDDFVQISQMQGDLGDLHDDLSNLSSNLKNLKNALSNVSQIQSSIEELIQFDLAHLVAAGIITQEEAAALGAKLNAIPSSLNGLVSATGKLLNNLTDATDSLQNILETSDGVLETLSDISDVLDDYDGLAQDFTAEGKKLTELVSSSLNSVDKLIDDIPALSTSLNQLTSDGTSAIDKTESLLLSLTDTLDTSYDMLNTANNILRSVRDKSDSSLQTSIDGLLDVLDKAARSNSSSSLQNATDSLHKAMDDAETDLEDDTNILNIDSEADLQSVTSAENPVPSSVQFILRTEEISVDDDDEAVETESSSADEGVFTRIANIFKKLFLAIYGVFASED